MTKEKKELTQAELTAKEDGAREERSRLLANIFGDKERLTMEYKQLVRHTGGLVSGSMAVAYSRAINDVIKLILKIPESKNVTVDQENKTITFKEAHEESV